MWGFDLAVLAEAQEDHTGIWPEHVAAVEAYLTVQTQWRISLGMAGLYAEGLDYQGVEAGLRMAGIEVTPELWAELRLIESGARDAKNGVRR